MNGRPPITQEQIDEAKCELEELEECGDLEDILEAVFALEDLERAFRRQNAAVS